MSRPEPGQQAAVLWPAEPGLQQVRELVRELALVLVLVRPEQELAQGPVPYIRAWPAAGPEPEPGLRAAVLPVRAQEREPEAGALRQLPERMLPLRPGLCPWSAYQWRQPLPWTDL